MNEVLYFLFIGVFFYAMMRWGCGAHMMRGGHGSHGGGHGEHGSGSDEKKRLPVRDPVCGMELDARAAKVTEQHRGGLYSFCSEKCRDEFKGNPDRYTQAA